ncbi:hypothetical protein TWF506_003024 [Arthrobotrys conoides]|uniref:Uncharacterized protein n=1 Tax=Arthrobotrys conoides TaxID=74498 RepID=A0AAN8N4V2_9PEZI
MFSWLASVNRIRFRSLPANLTGQRRRPVTVPRRFFTDSAIFNPSVKESHAAVLIIIAEFKKADIRITKKGVHFLKTAYASALSPKDTKNSLVLWSGLRRQILYGSIEPPDDLYETRHEGNESRTSAWRSQQTFNTCIDSNVFKIWEALYSRSGLFKEIIDKDEKENEAIGIYRDRWESHLQGYPLWEWLSHMLTTGIIEAADVDNLPEPYKLKGCQRKSGGAARVEGEKSSEQN